MASLAYYVRFDVPICTHVNFSFSSFHFMLQYVIELHIFLQMFVRLFVDENLDRVVPISKQPKDKIQAILEACDRQFPEFHVRSRKRIRTYLKSCRRMRRSKETTNGWEPVSRIL